MIHRGRSAISLGYHTLVAAIVAAAGVGNVGRVSAVTAYWDRTAGRGLSWATYTPLYSSVLDYDSDGRLDIYVEFDGIPARLYRGQPGTGLPQWVDDTGFAFPGGAAPSLQGSPSVADYDNDGDVDLLCASGSIYVNPDPSRRNRLYRNTGPPLFQFVEVADSEGLGDPCGVQAAWLAWGDLNGDGWLDVAATAEGPVTGCLPTGTGRVAVYLNQRPAGTGFAPMEEFLPFSGPGAAGPAACLDMDGDG